MDAQLMQPAIKEHLGEALLGLAVIVLAIWFVSFAWQRTGGGATAGGVQVTALFANASGVSVGTDVRIAGLKVGSVAAQRIDPQSFQAEVTLSLDPDVKVPSDSSAAITSEGLLGGTYVALLPGGDTTPLKNGDAILDTQGSTDLLGLIGQFINSSGGSGSGNGGSGSNGPAEDGSAPAAEPAQP